MAASHGRTAVRRHLLILALAVAGLVACKSTTPFDVGRFKVFRSSTTLGSQLFPVPPLPIRNWPWSEDALVLRGPYLYLNDQVEDSEIGHRFRIAEQNRESGVGIRGGGAEIVPLGADTRFSGRQIAALLWYLEAHARNLSIMRIRLWWTPESHGLRGGWRMSLYAGGSRPFGTPENVRWDATAPPSALNLWRRLVDDLLDASELRSIRLTRVDIDLRPGKNVMLLDGELQQPEQLDALRSVLAQLPGVRGMAGAEIITDGTPRVFTELVTELSPSSGL
jgi:hypothetical protein